LTSTKSLPAKLQLLFAKYFVGMLAKELKCPKPRLTEAGASGNETDDPDLPDQEDGTETR
jgi:hypothetical protein